jgi:hypothetical protein
LKAILDEIPGKKYCTKRKIEEYHDYKLYAKVVRRLATKFSLGTPTNGPGAALHPPHHGWS